MKRCSDCGKRADRGWTGGARGSRCLVCETARVLGSMQFSTRRKDDPVQRLQYQRKRRARLLALALRGRGNR